MRVAPLVAIRQLLSPNLADPNPTSIDRELIACESMSSSAQTRPVANRAVESKRFGLRLHRFGRRRELRRETLRRGCGLGGGSVRCRDRNRFACQPIGWIGHRGYNSFLVRQMRFVRKITKRSGVSCTPRAPSAVVGTRRTAWHWWNTDDTSTLRCHVDAPSKFKGNQHYAPRDIGADPLHPT